jgi:hypothetical protein
MYVYHNVEALLCNHCCCGKSITNTRSECESGALSIQHAERMCRNVLSFVACLDLPSFFTLYHIRHDFLNTSY